MAPTVENFGGASIARGKRLAAEILATICLLTFYPIVTMGQAVVYEPFDYPAGGLNGQSGATEVGVDGTWSAQSASLVAAGSLSFGALTIAGNKIGGLSGGSNRFGGTRAINASAFSGNSLLADGNRLWFSALVGYDSGGNATNSRLAVALADTSFNAGNFNYWLNGSGTTGLGLVLGRFSGVNGRTYATLFRDSSFGDATAGNVYGNFSGSTIGSGQHHLIVGRYTWAEDPADPDTLELFQPATDLVYPGTPISTLQTAVDQSGYDAITWARGDKVVLDEIRFGKSKTTPPGRIPAAMVRPLRRMP